MFALILRSCHQYYIELVLTAVLMQQLIKALMLLFIYGELNWYLLFPWIKN